MIKILMPWKNLGCLGIRITIKGEQIFYGDIYKSPHLGFYYNFRNRKVWGGFFPFPRIFKIEDYSGGGYRVYRRKIGWRDYNRREGQG